MIPSRGLARVSPGLSFQNQIFSRAPVRSIPGQARSRPAISSPRQFGTSLRINGKQIPRASTLGPVARPRIGAASILSSQSLLSSNRRFASTDSTTPPTSSAEHPAPAEHSPEPAFSSLSDLDPPSILNVPEGIGYLANLGLDYGRGPTSLCQWVLEHLHISMGLPWWGSIIGAALAIRAVMAYPALIAQYESHKSQEMRKDPVYQDRQAKFMKAVASGNSMDPAEVMQLRMQLKYIKEQHGVKTSAMFLPMLQIPLAYGMFKLTRGMATLPVPGLDGAGTLWFTDLTVADPLYILPCIGALLMYLSIRRSLPFMAKEQASLMKFMPFVLGPITVLVTLGFPAAVQLYFAAAAVLQYLQTMLWHVPAVRKLCGLPPLESTIINTEYQKQAPASPFANRQGTYQSPRTVQTTATEHNPVEAEKKNKGFQSPLSMWRDAKKQLKESMGTYMKNAAQAEREAAEKFEKKRVREENARYWARKGDAKLRQEDKHPRTK